MPLITVFTPAFNRAKLLPRLFESLQQQTFFDFEWIIVDDGSTDNTIDVISGIKEQNSTFPIIYIKQENQGKHIAINKGLDEAKGDYFFIVDSDDRLPKKSLQIINSKIQIIDKNPKIAGVVGQACYFDGTRVGFDLLKEEKICSLFDYIYKYKHQGDYENVIKTAVFKQFPFPKYLNEKFIAESIVWNRMGQKYDWYYFLDNVYECEYQEDGLSSKSIQLRRKYPVGAMNLYAELGQIKDISVKFRARALLNFWRFFFARNLTDKEKVLVPKVSLSAYLLMPIGFVLSFLDSKKK